MRGHVRKRGNSWTAVIYLGKDPVSGKKKYQWIPCTGDKPDAERRLREILTQMDTGTYVKPEKMTVGEYLEKWLTDHAAGNLTRRSLERYAGVVRDRLTPAIGKIHLPQLRPDHLSGYYAGMIKAGLSPQSVRYHHAVIHSALRTAVKWGFIVRNVADAVTPPRGRRQEMQTWTAAEVSRFLETARHTRWYCLFYMALYTGMRRSELLGLRWLDVDFLFSRVQVVRGLHQLKTGEYIFTEPKSAKSRRTIDMPPSLFLVLEAYRKAKEVEAKLMERRLQDEDLVFSNYEWDENTREIKSSPWRPNTVTRAWSDMCKKAGVKHIRLHDARHTHASLMLQQGIHPKIVQERLGHSSIEMTLDIYSHVMPGIQAAAARRFDDIFTGKPEHEEDRMKERNIK